MKDFMLPLCLVALVGLVSFSSEWVVAQQLKNPTRPYENPDAYAVYSAVLSMGGQWHDSTSLVILKEFPPKE